MKFRAICENHLYAKAYSKGKRAVTRSVAVYVLPDYLAVEKSARIKTGFLVVLAAREPATHLKSNEVARDLRAALDKLGLLLL